MVNIAGSEARIESKGKVGCTEYGIIECRRRNYISGYREKPELKYQVSMGFMLLTRPFSDLLKGEPIRFPDLVKLLIQKGKKPVRFPFSGYWKDIGCHTDYEKATEDLRR